MSKPKRPPKKGAQVVGGRAIDRLSPADRQRVLAQVKDFLYYAQQQKGKKEYVHS